MWNFKLPKEWKFELSAEKELLYGEQIPKYYGIAYRCYLRDYAICYLIPINLIVRFWHCWFYPKFMGPLKCPKWGKDFKQCNKANLQNLLNQALEQELLDRINKQKEKLNEQTIRTI